MPELPEVETIKNSLQEICLNTSIINSQVHTYKLRYPVLAHLNNLITNRNILAVERRAKYLILKLANGYLLFHFGMTGRLYVSQQYHKNNHEHLTLQLANGFVISFCDPRRFGAVIWIDPPLEQHTLIKNLGIEPFSKIFQPKYLYEKCRIRKISIKQLLMAGKVVVGIGNIYASEILFYSHIRPDRLTNTLSFEECKKICKFTRLVLTKAIKAGGTSIKDFKNPKSGLGYFTQQLLVYGRAGQNCLQCHHIVLRITQNNRSSFYCPNCQR